MFSAIFIFFLIAVLLIPDTAFAWGPATHLELGQAVLADARHLAEPVRILLTRFPHDFLYGNISADIVVGKNLVQELKHCHNWKIGFKLLRKAQTDSQKSFAYGYLSHLAADTIAHNHFIPEMMIKTYSARMLRHIYWEMRFDALAEKATWQVPKKLVREVHPDNDLLLDSIIEGTPLSFGTNKTLFSSMLSIQRFRQWHRMLNLLSATSKWSLDPDVKEKYFNSSFKAVKDFLTVYQKAPCVRHDPTGRHSLESAKLIRKKLLGMKRSGRDTDEAVENAVRCVRL